VNNDFTKYQAQTSPHPLGMEVSYAMGSYIYDSNNKNIWILLLRSTLGHQPAGKPSHQGSIR
jgi:hypothetical protein